MEKELNRREDLTDALFKKIAAYVYEHARINLTDKKRELVRSRLGKVIRTRGFGSYHEFYDYMISDRTGEALREVLNAVSTNLTSFFRESKHFDFLAAELLPQLIKECREGRRKRIRGWSAGCSSGEEVYTIGITLLECLHAPEALDIKLLASDIDTNMVAHGARGVYEAERLETVPGEIVKRYFAPADEPGSFAVKPALKRLVAFRYLNLMDPWPFKGKFDFIFCRNVMIYFDKETQQNLINRYYNALENGGHLFIGHSEGLTGIQHNFKYVQPTIYRR